MSHNNISNHRFDSQSHGLNNNTSWDNLDDWGGGSWSTPTSAESADWGSDPWQTHADTHVWGNQESDVGSLDQYEDPWGSNDFDNLVSYESGGGKLRKMAKAVIEAIKGKIGSPEAQDMAKQIAADYGRIALMGALDNTGITKDGRIRKRGVIKALFMPKRAARKAVMGAAGGLTEKARQDTEWYSGQVKDRLVDESTKRGGRIGGMAVRHLIRLSPI